MGRLAGVVMFAVGFLLLISRGGLEPGAFRMFLSIAGFALCAGGFVTIWFGGKAIPPGRPKNSPNEEVKQ